MRLLEELRSLDPRDPGRWPFAFRAGVVIVTFATLSLVATYFFVWTDLNPKLQQLQDQEQQLRNEFRAKHAKATNLDVYKQQLADIEKSFGAMLRQLPSKTEVESVLVDISVDQDQLLRQLPPVWPVRQQHRGAPAHRHAA